MRQVEQLQNTRPLENTLFNPWLDGYAAIYDYVRGYLTMWLRDYMWLHGLHAWLPDFVATWLRAVLISEC
jgi:hypothetical protein